MPGDFSFEIKYVIYGLPDAVFKALTNPGQIKTWSGGHAVLELKNGGTVLLFDGWVKGSIIAFEPGRMLRYTWKPSEWNEKAGTSEVELRIEPHQAGSLVTILHSGFPDKSESDKHKEGWLDYVLEPLNDFFIP